MRTYAPAETDAVLAGLLEEPSLARGVVHHAVLPARPADIADFPAWLDPRIVAGLARSRDQPAVHATRPRRSRRSMPARTSWS